MSRLVMPKFLTASALLSGKIDAVIAQLAAVINGGLTADDVKAGTTFPIAAFSEARGLYALRLECTVTTFGGNAANNQSIGPAKAFVPIASKVLGWGYVGHALATYARLSKSGVQISQIDGVLSATTGLYSGRTLLAPAVAVAAGDTLTALVGATSGAFTAIVMLDADHQG